MVWSLFNSGPPDVIRVCHYVIVDNVGTWPITVEHANKGLEEGWLAPIDYRIDHHNEEHWKLRMV